MINSSGTAASCANIENNTVVAAQARWAVTASFIARAPAYPTTDSAITAAGPRLAGATLSA